MKLKLLLLPLFVWGLVGCTDAEVGSKDRPFSMYFVPSVDAQQITRSAEELNKFVSKYVSQKLYGKDSGFYVRSSVPASYVAVVEAFGTKKADLAAFNTFSYILTKDIKKYPVEAILTIVREDGERTYKSQIITRVDSGINSLADLKGKKFAFSDPASTSGYILPSKLFKDKGIELGETVFAQKHDNVVTMVYQKQVDAGATYHNPPMDQEVDGKVQKVIRDARARVKTQFPDVEDKVKIIDYSMDIPNEPWVIRTGIFKDNGKDAKVKKAVREALMAFSKTPEGLITLKAMYGVHGLVTVNDSDYNEIRKIVMASGLDLQEKLKKK